MIIFVNNLAQIAWLISLFKKLGIGKNFVLTLYLLRYKLF